METSEEDALSNIFQQNHRWAGKLYLRDPRDCVGPLSCESSYVFAIVKVREGGGLRSQWVRWATFLRKQLLGRVGLLSGESSYLFVLIRFAGQFILGRLRLLDRATFGHSRGNAKFG